MVLPKKISEMNYENAQEVIFPSSGADSCTFPIAYILYTVIMDREG
jgi:hypothetical protein